MSRSTAAACRLVVLLLLCVLPALLVAGTDFDFDAAGVGVFDVSSVQSEWLVAVDANNQTHPTAPSSASASTHSFSDSSPSCSSSSTSQLVTGLLVGSGVLVGVVVVLSVLVACFLIEAPHCDAECESEPIHAIRRDPEDVRWLYIAAGGASS